LPGDCSILTRRAERLHEAVQAFEVVEETWFVEEFPARCSPWQSRTST
jgi:hypothetical protein